MIDKCHAEKIRFIARFDFSKAHERIFREKPEWFYRTRDGHEVNYYGIVHTCVNGGYQQDYSLSIIDEVLERYDVDGIFFNMFGYQERDYSGNEYGICCCDNCKEAFRERYGSDLPEREDVHDPVYRKYKQFQEETTLEMLDRIHARVKSRDPGIAISTYHHHKVEIVRKESNTAVDRQLPKWLYSASENVKSVEDTWDNKLISNCCINAVDLPYRFVGVSKHEVNVRLYESIASGSGLDYCIIGVFDGYPDRENFHDVMNVFRFHRDNEAYYGNLQSVAEIVLVKPDGPGMTAESAAEYRGIFKMLKEEHILFDVVRQQNLAGKLKQTDRYQTVILPDVRSLDADAVNALISRKQTSVIGTNQTMTDCGDNGQGLSELFSAHWEQTVDARASYAETINKTRFQRFPERDRIFLDGHFGFVRFSQEVETDLRYVSPAVFGPPERSGRHVHSDWYGLGVRRGQDGNVRALLPFALGALYERLGYDDHKRILMDVLDDCGGRGMTVVTDAPPQVELFFDRIDDRRYMLQLLNLSGFNGTTYFEPQVVESIDVQVNVKETICRATRLHDRADVPIQQTDGGIRLNTKRLGLYEAYVLETGSKEELH